MEDQMMIGVGIGVFILGIILGLLFGRRSAPGSVKQREVERRLDEVLQEQKAYQSEVMEHFSTTAQLLNGLTRSYRDVHQHLAVGASKLCDGETPMPMPQEKLEAADNELPPELAEPRQPLDYAPKTSPDDPGMLNESFGLDHKGAPIEEPQKSA